MLINEYWPKEKEPIRLTRAPQNAIKAKKATHLYHLGLRTLPPRDVQQVWLKREGSQACHLQGLPPFEKTIEARTIALRMDLELKLADREVAVHVRVDE